MGFVFPLIVSSKLDWSADIVLCSAYKHKHKYCCVHFLVYIMKSDHIFIYLPHTIYSFKVYINEMNISRDECKKSLMFVKP